MSRLCSSFRLRRHINQLVALKSRFIEVAAAVIVLHPADRCGDATLGESDNHGAQRQRFPGSRRRRRSRSSLLLRSGSLLLGRLSLFLGSGSLLLRSGSLLLGGGRLLLGLGRRR
jgi:hypothetical protein